MNGAWVSLAIMGGGLLATILALFRSWEFYRKKHPLMTSPSTPPAPSLSRQSPVIAVVLLGVGWLFLFLGVLGLVAMVIVAMPAGRGIGAIFYVSISSIVAGLMFLGLSNGLDMLAEIRAALCGEEGMETYPCENLPKRTRRLTRKAKPQP